MFEILQFDFMVRALIAGVAVAIIAPLIGMFLVVKRYSLMADTLAHVSFAGVALGLFLGAVNPVVTAIIASVVAAIGIERLRNSTKIFGESVLALFLSGSLAVAVILIGLAEGLNAGILNYLFGSITTVTVTDVVLISVLAVAVLAAIVVLYKEFFFISFDEELAQASGLRVKFLNGALVVLAAITVSLAARIVGVLLVGALMVIPVISAMQFGRGFRDTMLMAVMLSFVSVVTGLIASYYLDLASGGTIVVAALILFLLSLAAGKVK